MADNDKHDSNEEGEASGNPAAPPSVTGSPYAHFTTHSTAREVGIPIGRWIRDGITNAGPEETNAT